LRCTEITQELAQAATAGDGAAQRALVARLFPIIRARVSRVLRRGARAAPPSEHDIQDAAQDVWLALFADNGRALRAWRPGAGMSFDNYVGMIAERRSVSAQRRRTARIEGESLDEDSEASAACCDGPERRARARELLLRVIAHIEKVFSTEVLRSIDREWLGCADHELQSPQGSHTYAARYRVRRAARALRAQLDGEECLLLA
jgi:DNA-directed RNA polymerase specialized sigma24 family protein